MLPTVTSRDSRRIAPHNAERNATRREPLDRARRSQYLTLLRRWASERLPAGTKAAGDAVEWLRHALDHDVHDTERDGSFLVRMRERLLARRPVPSARLRPSSRVEQLVGRDRLEAWEQALGDLPERQRELAILRIEFGLDYEAIAAEMDVPAGHARAETVNALAALIDALGRRPCGRAA